MLERPDHLNQDLSSDINAGVMVILHQNVLRMQPAGDAVKKSL